MINITISCDDTNPIPGWGAKGDQQWKWMDELHAKYGIKMNHFIPSNYHGNAPISLHKDWIKWIEDKGYVEISAHGHFHETPDRGAWGECEFAYLQDIFQVKQRIDVMMGEWDKVGHKPLVWRSPGWLASPMSVSELSREFKTAAIHYEHNRGMSWGDCKMIFGADGINEEDIKLHHPGNTVMFQSHIQGEWNKNIWNEENYKNLDRWLEHLTSTEDVRFMTLTELSNLI